MAATLQEIVRRRKALSDEYDRRDKEWHDFAKAAKREFADLPHREAMIVGGLNAALIDAGRKVLSVMGDITKSVVYRDGGTGQRNARNKMIDNAMEDIATGGKKIRHHYFGIKNYSGFGDQREDHEYGMGPRHGSIVFSVRLTNEVRLRLNDGDELSQEEINAALYLLASLHKIEDARKETAAA